MVTSGRGKMARVVVRFLSDRMHYMMPFSMPNQLPSPNSRDIADIIIGPTLPCKDHTGLEQRGLCQKEDE